jgi:2-amino-4-hydroxy-6-hydroxymethyldihydropteridine diphosphokinase
MTTAFLALGSNDGDRMANLREACERLERHPSLTIEARSHIYETQSVEDGGPGDFSTRLCA